MMKKGMMAFAVLLFLVHSTHAGPNAAAVPALDLTGLTGANSTNDGVTSATGVAEGDAVTVEIFATGIASTLSGMDLQFTVDQAQASIPLTGGGYVGPFGLPIVQATGMSAASITGPVTIAETGYLGVVQFTIQAGVTATTEFNIELAQIILADASGLRTRFRCQV